MEDLITISSDALPDGTRVLRFSGTEGISRTYEFEVYLLVPHDASAGFDMESALLQPATLMLNQDDGTPRTKFQGLWSSLELIHELNGDALYRGLIVPRFWQLKLTEHSHIYTDVTVPDMIKKVLQMGGLSSDDFDLRLSKSYTSNEHICQYHESYFDFVSRWFEREGMYYFFEHGDSQDKLIITDDKSFHERFAEGTVRHVLHGEGDVSIPEGLESFTCRHAALPGQVRLEDYDYLHPDLDLSGTAPVATNGKGKISRYGDNCKDPKDGKRLAGIRAQELLCRQVRYRGAGRVFDLRSGYKFELTEHPRESFNTEYLTVELEHVGSNAVNADLAGIARMLGMDPSRSTYRVEVVAIPATVQYRAECLTPTPRIYSFEGATVDGAEESDYAQIDSNGRYKIKVHFDESDLDNGKASTWVRMAQPHGGSPEGFHFPLRKDTEVLLLFLGGDPDRPLISGVVPNQNTPSPVTADNHTMNVIHTGGNNRLEIQDQEGGEYMKMKTRHNNTVFHIGAPHNPDSDIFGKTDGKLKFDLGDNMTVLVGKDHDIQVTGTSSTKVGGDVDVSHEGKETKEVKGDVEVTLHANKKEVIQGTSHEVFIGDKFEDLSGNETSKTGGNKTETIQGNETTTIIGNSTETISGSKTESVTGTSTETFMGMKTELMLAGTFEMSASLGMEIMVSGKFAMSLSATMEINFGAKMESWIGASTEIGAGANTEINNGAKTDINNGVSTEINNAVKIDVKNGVELEKGDLTLAEKELILKNHGIDIKAAGLTMVD